MRFSRGRTRKSQCGIRLGTRKRTRVGRLARKSSWITSSYYSNYNIIEGNLRAMVDAGIKS